MQQNNKQNKNQTIKKQGGNRGDTLCKKKNYMILTYIAITGSPARLNEVPIN